LKAAFPEIEFGNRTKGPHKNRAYTKGLGFYQHDLADNGRVVQFPQAMEK
jgi:hypothetical protein